MSENDSESSPETEHTDDAKEIQLITKYWIRMKQLLTSSRFPFLLLVVLCVLVVVKVLLVLCLEWMIIEEVIHNQWLYSNPYDPSDIVGTPEIILALANRWDSHHFIEIARNGYPVGVENDLRFAFAPVYPYLVAMVDQVVGNLYVAGVIVSNVFYFLSIIAFYKVARMYMDYEQSCLLALVFGMFPIYLVYGTLAYSEAPFLFFAIASWYFFKKEQYLPCAIFTTLSILTRYISGLLVLIYGLIILFTLIHKYKEEKSLLKAFDFQVLWFAIPAVCVTAVFLYFQSLTGNFFVAFDSHVFFGDTIATPYHQFRWFFDGYFTEVNSSVEPFKLMIQRYMFTIPFFVLALILLKDDVELGLYGYLFMWITLSMEGISGIASPRIMLSAWVAFLALKDRMSSALYIVMSVMFFFVGIWVMYQFQLTFFA